MFKDSIEWLSLEETAAHLALLPNDNCLIVCDENTSVHCLSKLKLDSYPNLVLKAGERTKSIDSCQHIWSKMIDLGMDRNGTLVGLGGGVITDLVGFCASTYKRGIQLIQLPTSLLAMVDAAHGGKTGINFNGYKNNLGTFTMPEDVLMCLDFLDTLPYVEVKEGFAEIIKHSLIADKGLWDILHTVNQFSIEQAKEILPNSLQVKMDIVGQDPFENHERKKLNFGHTIGHAIEATTGVTHGHAIAAGMYCESYISMKENKLPEQAFIEISKFISSHYEKVDLLPHLDLLKEKMLQDKKNDGDRVNFTLLNSIGSSSIDHYPPNDCVTNSLEYYQLNA